jgi:hypothetical protein
MNSLGGISGERKNSVRKRIRFWKWRTASGQMELRIRNYLCGFIPKVIGYGQSFFRISARVDTMRIHAVCQFCRYERKPVADLSDSMETSRQAQKLLPGNPNFLSHHS